MRQNEDIDYRRGERNYRERGEQRGNGYGPGGYGRTEDWGGEYDQGNRRGDEERFNRSYGNEARGSGSNVYPEQFQGGSYGGYPRNYEQDDFWRRDQLNRGMEGNRGGQNDFRGGNGNQGNGNWLNQGQNRNRNVNINRTDDEIRDGIYDALDDDWQIPGDVEIEVKVENKVVTLTGAVRNRTLKDAASRCAWDEPGVRDVHNNISISSRRERAANSRGQNFGQQGNLGQGQNFGAAQTGGASKSGDKSQTLETAENKGKNRAEVR